MRTDNVNAMAERPKRYTYKNTTDQPLAIMGVGEVKAGGQITTTQEVNNPNLELVKTAKPEGAKTAAGQRTGIH